MGWKLTGASCQRTLNNHPFGNNGHVAGEHRAIYIFRNIQRFETLREYRGNLYLLLLCAVQSQTLKWCKNLA